jgi:cytochrome c556
MLRRWFLVLERATEKRRITSQWRVLGGMLVIAALVASQVVRADNDDTIDYREHIMKTMSEQSAAISMILEHKAPPDNFNTHVQILAVTASTALKAFEPKVVGGYAKPEVWANWVDFSKRMNEFTTNITALAKIARTSGFAAAAPKVQTALTCKGCHDTYCKPLDK